MMRASQVALTPVESRVRAAGALRAARLSAAERRSAGVVHTPPELASFCVRAVDALVRRRFGLAAGIADASVALIDPACGPGAFLAAAIADVQRRGLELRCALRGFDLDDGAIVAARTAIGPALERDVDCLFEARDTLAALPPRELSDLRPLPIVLGNPPWIGSAQARPAPELDRLLYDFRHDEHGRSLGERKLGVLSDAYVRFMRWSAEVARLGARGGALALVTNSSYLDGPVHRGLRAALARWFVHLDIVDLGGNALIARRGERDGNVFGVRPGVAVLIAACEPGQQCFPRQVRHTLVGGNAAEKLSALGALDLELAARPVVIDPGHYRFGPTRGGSQRYLASPSLSEVMPFHREGVQTNRDAVVIDADRDRLIARLTAFAEGRELPELSQARVALPHYDPQAAVAAVQRALREDPDGSRGLLVRPIAYRPFDTRWFAPHAPLCHRARPALLAAMQHSELALVSVRKDRGREPWTHAAVARDVVDNCFLSTRSSCRARAFPTHGPDGRPNLDASFAADLAERVGRAPDVSDVVLYALAVLWMPSYRAENQDALRADYPRLPWPRDPRHFERVRGLGAELAELFSRPVEAGGAGVTIGHHHCARGDRFAFEAILERIEREVDA